MNEFDYEVLQRKRIANQAKYRKNGSRQKKCSLPSDGMSHKQWKERNGEIVSVRMNQPMSWGQFKKLSRDSQQLYICTLQELYDASLKGLSDMFGVHYGTMQRHLKNQDIVFNADRRKRSAWQQEMWKRFCSGEAEQESTHQPAEAAETAEAEVPIEDLVEFVVARQSESEPPRKAGMLLDKFTLQFSGEFDPDAVRNSLAMILQKGQRVRIEINCTMEG